MFDNIIFGIGVILFHVMGYLNFIYPPIGSIYSSIKTNDYHDGLVFGDACTLLVGLCDIVVIVLVIKSRCNRNNYKISF